MDILDILQPDDCCNKRLSKALEKGQVRGTSWICPKCRVEWRGTIKESEGALYRKWEPYDPITVFRV